MSAQAKVISVNPGKKTLGRFWEEGLAGHEVGRRIIRTIAVPAKPAGYIAALTGISTDTGRTMSLNLLLLRLLLGCGMIVMAAMLLVGTVTVQVAAIVAGVSILLGMFCRPVCIIASILFAITTFNGLDAGMFQWETAVIGVVSVVFAVLGPGRFSVDQLIRSALIRLGRK